MRARWKISIGAVNARAHYLEAGADAIFPEALQTPEEFKRFAQEVKAAAAREHDGVRQEPAAELRRAGGAWLSNGDFPAERVSRFDESEREIFARSEKARDAIGLDRQDADAGGALRIARLRSGGGKLERVES